MDWLKMILDKLNLFEGKEDLKEQFTNELEQQISNELKGQNTGELRKTQNFQFQEDSQTDGRIVLDDKNSELQRKYEQLQKKYNDDIQALNKRIENNTKESLIDREVAKAGGRNTKAIKALLNMDKIMVKEDGTLEGLDLEAVKKSDAYLFNVETQGIEGTGFVGGDSNIIDTKNMNYTQLCELLEKNPNAKID